MMRGSPTPPRKVIPKSLKQTSKRTRMAIYNMLK
jgi:hypothetical protein